MKLKYPTEPEIMTVTSPLGTLHRIPVWMPIGERSAPVFVELAPCEPRAINHVWLKDRICEYFKANDPGDRGLTHWAIADAMGENRQTVGRSLQENEGMFRCSSNVALVDFRSGNKRSGRKMPLNLWHLRKEKI